MQQLATTCAFSLAAGLVTSLLACGGGHESDPILEAELALEAERTEGGEHEATPAEANARRLRAVETRIYEACYDGLDQLPEHAADRRRRRHAHLLSRRAVAGQQEEAGVAIEGSVGPQAVRPGGVTNVDPTDTSTPYTEDELAIIVLEDRFDAFHAEHPDPAAMTSADITELEDLGDELHDACMRTR